MEEQLFFIFEVNYSNLKHTHLFKNVIQTTEENLISQLIKLNNKLSPIYNLTIKKIKIISSSKFEFLFIPYTPGKSIKHYYEARSMSLINSVP